MKTYVLATVGNSMLQGFQRAEGSTQAALPDVRRAVDFLRRRDPHDPICGVEINSVTQLLEGKELSSGAVRAPLGVELLVSDTPQGEWSGRALVQYFRDVPDIEAAEAFTVAQLRGDDPKCFAHQGLRSLVKLVAARLRDARQRHPDALQVIEASGGYKAQISLVGLLGQAMKVPVLYLFEGFRYSIELPPLPVSYDRSLWIEHEALLRHLSEAVCVPAAELRRSDVADELWTLLDRETIDGIEYVSLSPMLELMHQAFALTVPPHLTPPPDSDRSPDQKVRLNEAEMAHAPKGSRERIAQLARFPWVIQIENVRFVDTGIRWQVKTGGVEAVDEIRVVHGDGNKGLEIRLRTTSRAQGQREWCLEALRQLG